MVKFYTVDVASGFGGYVEWDCLFGGSLSTQ